MNFDWKSGIIVFLLIVILLPKWGQAWKALCDFIGYEPKSLRKEREQEEKNKKLFEKQEEYHQQSIRIRDEFYISPGKTFKTICEHDGRKHELTVMYDAKSTIWKLNVAQLIGI